MEDTPDTRLEEMIVSHNRVVFLLNSFFARGFLRRMLWVLTGR